MTDIRRFDDPTLEEHYVEVHHESGLTVLVSPKDFSTYHAALGVAFGSGDRPARRRTLSLPTRAYPGGVAHFLEHKMFERPGGSFDEDFAALGAEANAYTSYDRTVYMFSCTDRFPEALETLLGMTSSLTVTADSVARERAIIAEELRMNADDPWERCYAELLRALYRTHPVRDEICGSEATLRRITPHLLREAFDSAYRPDRMVLAVSGRVTPEAVLAAVDRAWGGRPADRPAKHPTECAAASPILTPTDMVLDEPALPHTPRVTVHMEAAKPLFAIGIKAPPPPPGARAGLVADIGMTVLAEMLFSHSGAFYSDLFERGLISPGLSYGSSLGEGYAYYALSGECDDPDAVYNAFRAYIAEVRHVGLSPAEFRRARRILYGDYLSGFDATEDIAASLGGYALDTLRAHPNGESADRVGLYDFLPAVDALTLADVTALFDAAFAEEHFALSVVLPKAPAAGTTST